MKVLVTGSTGFVGRHLLSMAEQLQTRFGAELVLPAGELDLRDADSVEASIGPCHFDALLHLAAQSSVPDSFADPAATFRTNVLGTVHLLSHLGRRGFKGRFLLVSTGDVYGLAGVNELPVTESTTPRPGNPYAASKLGAEAAALAWGRRGQVDALVARPFNHIGPGQGDGFAVARFAHALARIKRDGEPPELSTGRLDVTRDFLDVRDVVCAYFHLLAQGRSGEIYNVCSGVERQLGDMLQALIRISGMQVGSTIDPLLIRPVDLARMVGSADKLRRDTGWSAEIPIERTLSDLFAYSLGSIPS